MRRPGWSRPWIRRKPSSSITKGANPPDFDYAFNLTYGTAYFQGDPLLEALREELDAGTRARLCEGENNRWKGETR